MKITNTKLIEDSEWDKTIQKTYKRPYGFQQQNDCREGAFQFFVPKEDHEEEHQNQTVPDNIDDNQTMGVSFDAWLKRDPKTPLANQQYDFELELWWQRNFYPDTQMLLNDLHRRKLIDAGDYVINID